QTDHPSVLLLFTCFSDISPPPHHLPSSPTRRSSDLVPAAAAARRAAAVRPDAGDPAAWDAQRRRRLGVRGAGPRPAGAGLPPEEDRKSTRLNSSHRTISYAVFCLKKKNKSDNEHHES